MPTERIDRDIDPDAEIEIPFLGWNGEEVLLRIRRCRFGSYGAHDELRIIVDGEDVGDLLINQARSSMKDNRRAHSGYVSWFARDEPFLTGRAISFNLREPAPETTLLSVTQNVRFRRIQLAE